MSKGKDGLRGFISIIVGVLVGTAGWAVIIAALLFFAGWW
jgi:hypothetical protein